MEQAMNSFIVADPAKCIGCRTCEVACVVSHQENQNCAAVTAKTFTSRRVEQQRCIGCKSCMIACPFGAMQVTGEAEAVQALKCDRCAHREGGPACVEACPTRALSCVDPARLRAERLRYLA